MFAKVFINNFLSKGLLFLISSFLFFGLFAILNKVSAEPAIILGKVTGIQFGCPPDNYFYYGRNTGEDNCKGRFDYTVTWQQTSTGRSDSINNNSESAGTPRYTFEFKPESEWPNGDADGEDIYVHLSLNGAPYTVGSWIRTTTDQNGIACAPGDSGTDLPVHTQIYRSGGCRYNHIWFFDVRPYNDTCTWQEIIRTPGGSYGPQTLGRWKRVNHDGHPEDGTYIVYTPATGPDVNWWTVGYNDSLWSNQGYVHWETNAWHDYDYFPVGAIGQYAWLAADQENPNAVHKTDLHRRTFTLPTDINIIKARVQAFSDNGAQYFINGVSSVHTGGTANTYTINPALLHAGSNLLAIQLSNTNNPMGLQYLLEACVSSIVATPTPPAWMITQGGDVFSEFAVKFGVEFMQNTLRNIAKITNANLPGLNDKKPYFSSYNYLQDTNAIGLCTNCSGFNNTNRNYYPTVIYNDKNDKPDEGWYNYIQNKLTKSDLIDEHVFDASKTYANANQLPLSIFNHPTEVTVLDLFGDLHLTSGFTCSTQTIFLVKGNLYLDPDLQNLANNRACLFVVNGTTFITNGARKSSPGNVNYDLINAFIITNKIETQDDTSGGASDGLVITGGVITSVSSFGRKVNTVLANTPSEIINYDPRYLQIFKNYLDEPINFSIREKPYIDLVQ